MARLETVTIAITCSEGLLVMGFGVREISASGNVNWEREPTDEAISAEITKAIPNRTVTGWRRIAEADLPQDRTYRRAWRDTGTAIDHDMAKARDAHRDLLREQRAEVMAKLDTAYLQADEAGNAAKKQEIAQKKQLLRDAPADPRIAAAQTIGELKQIALPRVEIT